jgi:CBS domain containing-hemolysin-like protein
MRQIESLGYHFSDLLNLLIQTVLSTLIVLITAEFLPKVFFQIYANGLIKFCAASLFSVLFYFISTFLICLILF